MSGYITTRGGPAVALQEALFAGTAPDGGLFVPERLPQLPWPPPSSVAPGGHDPRPIAAWAAPALFPSLDLELLRAVVDEALDFPIPLVEVESDRWVLELFHGPTHAFKDVGARFMAALMSRLEPGPESGRTILVATSGDTGGAVASAFHGMPGYSVVALFPAEGISVLQRRQMTTLGDNVHAVAVRGSFDDCQRLAKAAFADEGLATEVRLTSANSINIARLLPQAIYYLHAASSLERPWFVVPSGNLGNLCAGLIAQRGGMPAAGFTAAVNENQAFADFLQGSPYEPLPSVRTTSSAMDVGDPSNLERIRWLFGGDDDAVRGAIRGVAVDQGEVARCIREVHVRTGHVLDPHTAVAYAASARHNAPTDAPLVVLATAHPAKFPETVQAAIGESVPTPSDFPSPDTPEKMSTLDAELTELALLLRSIRA